MAGSADLEGAISAAWDDSGLNEVFNSLWSVSIADYPVLHDQEATPDQPFPYCVFEKDPGETIARMSGGRRFKMEVRNIPVRFNIHTRALDDDSRSAKEIARDLVSELMKVFGGHPTEPPTHDVLELANGKHLQTQYLNDYGVRTGDDEYQWIVNYGFMVDVPVQLGL